MGGYVEKLRKYVGHEPIILVGTNVIIQNDKGEVLLQRRIDFDCWCLPGGNMELGECVEDTARRELFEETGLTAKTMLLVDVLSGPEYYFEYPNGDQVYSVICVFKGSETSGELLMERHECLGLDYFPLTELPNLGDLPKEIIRKHLGVNI
jgi:8-oxo-dGTP pyrophosphatase MutT (NUDIX family)